MPAKSTSICVAFGLALFVHAFEIVDGAGRTPYGNTTTRPLTATASPAISTGRLSLRTFMSVPSLIRPPHVSR